jgi:hypothetical protein
MMTTSSSTIRERFRLHPGQAAVALCVVLIGCGQELRSRTREELSTATSTSDSVSRQAATGSGHVTVDGTRRTFTFSAVSQSDGSVSGHAELFNRQTGFLANADVICLTLIGNRAWMGGIIKHSDEPGCEGTNIYFNVQDNGEGSNGEPDLLSLAEVCDVSGDAAVAVVNAYCDSAGATDPFLPIVPVEHGNIQVRE